MSKCVWVYSPYMVVTEAMIKLLASLDFEACKENAPHVELALWDLTTTTPPFPAPPPCPTLAIITGGELEAVSLLHRHYRGYITSTDDGATLKLALEAVRRGEIWADRTILTRVIDSFEDPRLTQKEQEVFHQLTRGLSNRAIGQYLGIAEGTVKMHVSRIFAKLGVKRRTELIARHFAGEKSTLHVQGAAD